MATTLGLVQRAVLFSFSRRHSSFLVIQVIAFLIGSVFARSAAAQMPPPPPPPGGLEAPWTHYTTTVNRRPDGTHALGASQMLTKWLIFAIWGVVLAWQVVMLRHLKPGHSVYEALIFPERKNFDPTGQWMLRVGRWVRFVIFVAILLFAFGFFFLSGCRPAIR